MIATKPRGLTRSFYAAHQQFTTDFQHQNIETNQFAGLRWIDLTRRVVFDGNCVRCDHAFGIASPSLQWLSTVASSKPWIGVNCSAINHYVPHASGTHTETVGHIVPMEIQGHLSGRLLAEPPPFGFYSAVITVCYPEQVTAGGAMECLGSSYPSLQRGDFVIVPKCLSTLESLALEEKLEAVVAVVLLVLDASDSLGFSPDAPNPPYIHPSTIDRLKTILPNATHFMTNLPSVDRAQDGGLVLTHRALFANHDFWLQESASEDSALNNMILPQQTVTELLSVPRELCHVQSFCGTIALVMAPLAGLDALPSSVFLLR